MALTYLALETRERETEGAYGSRGRSLEQTLGEMTDASKRSETEWGA